MTETSQTCILVVADSDDVGELVGSLSEPLPTAVTSRVDVVVTGGGDDAIDVFAARRPPVVVVSATLIAGDAASLVDALRGMAGRDGLGVVVVGDREGPHSTAAGVAELQPDKFVPRPIIGRAVRFAVASALERVLRSPSGISTSPGTDPGAVDDDATKAAQRARWEALADSLVDIEPPPDETAEAAPLPPQPAKDPWADAPLREPTFIIPDHEPAAPPKVETQPRVAEPRVRTEDLVARVRTEDVPPAAPRANTKDGEVNLMQREAGGEWTTPMPLSALVDRESNRSLRDDDNEPTTTRGPISRNPSDELLASVEVADDLQLDDFDDDLVVIDDEDGSPRRPTIPRAAVEMKIEVVEEPDGPPQRDFARQLRAKMSMMAQRLFQGSEGSAGSGSVDISPKHDHHTEIDLASLGEETPLGGNTEIEARSRSGEIRDPTTSPGSWETAVRERGLPDGGDIVRGVSDAPVLVARMFATGATGRVTFRRQRPEAQTVPAAPPIEKVVYFDQGRPVFASSSETRDRMGELLVREGKITASQYERCQTVVAESGRRMGEILVDVGYLKRRELLPAVRRHVEDIVYSLFGWDRGHYTIAIELAPSAERIRLSRHPAALVLEGIRRKLDRSTLERLIGPPSTILEVADRDRVSSVINTGSTGDLSAEERAALAAIDGQSDLLQVARTAGVDLADVLPLAWGLCVLGLATARRTDTEIPDESTALVGETDLAIDRERVRARWALVTDADYFALLGVRRDATTFEIRRAYQSARRDFSSDTFPVDLRRELAQELDDIANVLDEAFRVLRDDRLRGTYLANLIE